MQTQKIKVVLVDDDIQNYDIINDLLYRHRSIQFTGYCPEENAFKELIRKTDPDIALLDIMLFSRQGGLDLLQWLQKEKPQIRSIMITASLDNVSESYRMGASGYLLKGNWSDVVPCILNVYKGDTVVPNPIAKKLVAQMIDENKKQGLMDDLNVFTQREIEILSLIHKGYTNTMITSRLNVSPFTLKRHLQNIRNKNGDPSLENLLEKFKDVL